MCRFKSRLFVSIFISAMALVVPCATYAQTSDVRVVNPASNPVQTKIVNPAGAPVVTKIVNGASTPVPVSGTVKVGNTATSPVPVTGSVNIGNAAASPVLVRIVDEAARTPYQQTLINNTPTFNVPPGKRLVIEFASAHVIGPIDVKVLDIKIITRLTQSAAAQAHHLVAVFQGRRQASGPIPQQADDFTASQQMRVYAGPGTEVTAVVDGSSSVVFNLTFSGYLESVPAATSSSPDQMTVPAPAEDTINAPNPQP